MHTATNIADSVREDSLSAVGQTSSFCTVQQCFSSSSNTSNSGTTSSSCSIAVTASLIIELAHGAMQAFSVQSNFVAEY
eukprot:21438-Heterococcus_DN1.PRE.2